MSLRTGLQAWFSLDEASGNAVDATGGGNDLTAVNAPGAGSGKVSGGRHCVRATPSYFTHTDNAVFSGAGNAAKTFAFWIKFDSASGGVMGKYGGSGSYEWVVGLQSGTTTPYFLVSDDGTASGGHFAQVNGSNIGTGVWAFVVCWYDPTAHTLNIQINNGTVASISYSTGIFDGPSDFQLGNNSYVLGPMDGWLDEFAIWNRVLSSSERTALYNSGNGLSYAQTAPPVITTSSLPNGESGEAYDAPLAVTGGLGSITWSKTAGSSDLGITGSDVTSAALGAAGSRTITVVATDSIGNDSAPVTLTFTVTAPVTNGTTFDEVLLDTAYSADAEGGPEFATAIVGSGEGGSIKHRAETREDYISKYDILFGELSNTRRRTLRDFAVLRKGMARGFRFLAPDDNQILQADGIGWLNPDTGEVERISTMPASNTITAFYLIRTYDDAINSYVRRIVKPSPLDDLTVTLVAAGGGSTANHVFAAGGSIVHTATATVTTPFYSGGNRTVTINYWTGKVTVTPAIPEGGSLYVTGTYHVPVAFSEDWQKFKVDEVAISEFRVSLEEILPKELGIT